MIQSLNTENAINSWSDWDITLCSRPVVLGPLSGGRSNCSYLLESDGMKMVLRLNGSESALPGANRNSEYEIWQAASAQGIAPPLLYVDDQSSFLVSTFIENNLPSQPERNSALINHAFDLLERCHLLDLDVPCIDYAGHIEEYWQIIEKRGHSIDPELSEKRDPMQGLLEEIINSDTQTGLCHHDLVRENFVGTQERLYLIDWEYASKGLLVMDYAVFGVEWSLSDEHICAHTDIEPELINKAKSHYRYLCDLWKAVTI